MKLAVMKKQGRIPGAGYDYVLMPVRIPLEQVSCWELMGHVILDVPDATGELLLKAAEASFVHQCQVAVLTEQTLGEKK